MRTIALLILTVLISFVLPTAIMFSLGASYVRDRGISSGGILPAPEAHPEARILVMSARTARLRGVFSHSWIVLKGENGDRWNRYEVLGWGGRGIHDQVAAGGQWFGNKPVLNHWTPDGHWFGNYPEVLVDISGPRAAVLISKIMKVIETYGSQNERYRTWPGPNSNTFVATILRAAPELGVVLPPTALGKDFRPGIHLGWTDTKTGIETNIAGVFGVRIGRLEGLEVNVLGLIVGLDFCRPGIKLPGFGLIQLGRGGTANGRVAAGAS